MRRRRMIRWAALAILMLPAVAAAPAPDVPARPNVILCMADDLGWGDTGYNGHPVIRTPNLDRMAREGLRLDRFYAASAVCSPTRASVLTGRSPQRAGTRPHLRLHHEKARRGGPVDSAGRPGRRHHQHRRRPRPDGNPGKGHQPREGRRQRRHHGGRLPRHDVSREGCSKLIIQFRQALGELFVGVVTHYYCGGSGDVRFGQSIIQKRHESCFRMVATPIQPASGKLNHVSQGLLNSHIGKRPAKVIGP